MMDESRVKELLQYYRNQHGERIFERVMLNDQDGRRAWCLDAAIASSQGAITAICEILEISEDDDLSGG